MLNADWIESEVKRWFELKGYGADERNTEDKILVPMLKKLGWDILDYNQVRAQFNINGEKADYVLFGDNEQPLVLIEMKQVSDDLNKLIQNNYLDEQKYLSQTQKIGALICIISNGLTYRIYVNDIEHSRLLRCRSLEIDLYYSSLENLNMELLMRFLEFILRDNIINGKSYLKMLSIAKREQDLNNLRKSLLEPDKDLVSFLAQKLKIDESFIRSQLPYLINKESTQIIVHDVDLYDEDISNSRIPVTGPYVSVVNKMFGETEGDKKWRKKIAKYSKVWMSFQTKDYLTQDEIIYCIKDVVKAKGRGQFFSTYAGSKTQTPLLVENDRGYTVASELKYVFSDFLKLLDDEIKQENKR